MAAQTGVGLVLGALVWGRRVRPWPAAVLLLGGDRSGRAMPVEGDFFRGLGMTLGPEHAKNVLRLAAAMASVGCLVTRQWRLALVALLGEAALWPITTYIVECDIDLAAAHLAFFGMLVGLYRDPRRSYPRRGERGRAVEPRRRLSRMAARRLATTRSRSGSARSPRASSADGAARAHRQRRRVGLHLPGGALRAAARVRQRAALLGGPPELLRLPVHGPFVRSVHAGMAFFMTPFVLFRVPSLAGPASLGLLAGPSRGSPAARPRASTRAQSPSALRVRAGGSLRPPWSSSLDGPHQRRVAVSARLRRGDVRLVARGALRLAQRDLPVRLQTSWGAVLGGCAALLLAARPADGATLGFGLLVYFVYAVVRRRVAWRGIGVAAAVAGCSARSRSCSSASARRWFKTGYSLAEAIYPWERWPGAFPRPTSTAGASRSPRARTAGGPARRPWDSRGSRSCAGAPGASGSSSS